jgi:hypothetical protein
MIGKPLFKSRCTLFYAMRPAWGALPRRRQGLCHIYERINTAIFTGAMAPAIGRAARGP